MAEATVVVDLSKIADAEFDATRPLVVAALKGDTIVDKKTIVPEKSRDPRHISVRLSVGDVEDGAAGAQIVVAPADDERNLRSPLTARKFVAGTTERIEGGTLVVSSGIYSRWRVCWFPRSYHVSGRVIRRIGNCDHPVPGAQVHILDVDYCWWWYNEDAIITTTTDVNGFFDVTFTWCRPLWCYFRLPVLIDPSLWDRIHLALQNYRPIKFPFPPPPDPWEWERRLVEMNPDVSVTTLGAELGPGAEPGGARSLEAPSMFARLAPRAMEMEGPQSAIATALPSSIVERLDLAELLKSIIHWPPCDSPCDWNPDIKIRVTQNQPGGTVTIYEDTYAQIRWNVTSDVTGLTLLANASALYTNACGPGPLLGNCMQLDSVGNTPIQPSVGDPLGGIYQPNFLPGLSYGAEPDRRQRLGYVKNYDRPFAGTLSVYGRFGIAAGVDYYQMQMAKWTAGDLLAWDVDHTHVPPDAAFVPVPVTALVGFSRRYLEESPFPSHWNDEPFSPQTVGGIASVYKSRERFEHEYNAAHGGADPAPSFGGWYWSYFTETRLFDLDSHALANGYYTFRFVCYKQTGVDGMGNPILAPVTMGLPSGIGRRCGVAKPELLTLYLHDHPHRAGCEILTFTKNGTSMISECAMVTLTATDWIELEYRAQDLDGHLDSFGVTLQKGASLPVDLFTLAGVTLLPGGSDPEGPTYGAALVDVTAPAVPPYWYGGTWKRKVPYSTFVAMGGSCAYNLRVSAYDRHTNGFAHSTGWAETWCEKNRAFTVILA